MGNKMKCVSEKTRKLYKKCWVKFGFRIVVLLVVIWIVRIHPEELEVLKGMNFFRHFSVLHILWGVWMWYMVEKLLPLKNHKPKGCMKYMKSEFQPTKEYQEWESQAGRTQFFKTSKTERSSQQLKHPASEDKSADFVHRFQMQKKWYTKGAIIVVLAWGLVAVVIYFLQKYAILGIRELLIGSCLFYIGDLVCILIWCPFRDVLMKNRCCTQCRIYNWDTIMLILPILYIPGFFSYSLLAGAVLVVGIWEGTHWLHPERFYPMTNANLQCGTCKGELGCRK